MKIMRFVMISYVEAMAKNYEGFTKVDTCVAYKSKHLRRSSRKLGVKVTGEFGFDFKTFCIGKHNLDSFIPNFGYFSNPFDNFKFFMQLNISRRTIRP